MFFTKFTEHNKFKGQINDHQSYFDVFIKSSLFMSAAFARCQT